MSREQLIGVDIGTSRCRAVLFDRAGRSLAACTRHYPILNPRPGWQEQDPRAVLRAFLDCLREIVPLADRKRLAGIGLSGYLNSILPIGDENQPLGNCMIWTDTRSGTAARLIAANSDRRSLYFRTGCPVHPMYPLCKIRWLREEDPETFSRTRRFLSMKEYIVQEVFGEYIGDWSDASGSGLLDIHTRQWDEEALSLAGIELKHLSTLRSPLTVLPPMKTEYMAAVGLDEAIPIVLGGADGLLSNIGVGAVGELEANNTVGTGGAVRVFVPEPKLDDAMRTWCYVSGPDHWAVGGVTAGGLIYEWFIRELAQEERREAEKREMDVYRLLEESVHSVPPGSEGLLFLPFLVGARTPSWNPGARGTLFGLSYYHSREHIVRALMEGVVYNFFSVFKAVEQVSEGIQTVYASGGFVNSNTWMQITADVYGRELVVPDVTESTAFGAMFMAMLALGLAQDLKDVKPLIRHRETVRPNPAIHEVYTERFDRFNRLYERIEAEFEPLSDPRAPDNARSF